MNKEDLNYLNALYNTLICISTKGEDTILMGECIKSLKEFIYRQNNTQQKQRQKRSLI